MSGILQILLGGSQAPAVDPYFYSVTSLLHGDGTNGGQNNTFLDSSSNNFTITRNGNTTQGSFSPFSQTGWGNYFQGSGNYLTLADATQFNLSGAAYTIECWIYPNGDYGNYNTIVAKRATSSSSTAWEVYLRTGSGVLSFYNGTNYESAITPPSNQWSHIAAVYDGTNINLYLNGVRVLQSAITNSNISASVFIGTYPSYDERYIGHISNLRITKGAALYTGASFTVPTTALTTTVSSGTVSLLTCQSNRFIDNSVNAAAITVTGNPSVQPFSPFNPTTAYSAGSIGGSGYFDGSGDYLSLSQATALSLGTGDFSVEAWVYPTANPSSFWSIIDARGSAANIPWAAGLRLVSGALKGTFYNGADIQGSITVPLNAWTHIVFSRVGSTLRSFINGVVDINTTMTTNLTAAGTQYIGAIVDPTYNTGYMTDVRIVKGSGVTSVTVPTAPLTAITNTQLLLSYTNGAIFDNAAVADYETVGNAQISTSVKKYGTGSMSFDGTGDYLTPPAGQNFVFGSGDFTIECWVYPTAFSAYRAIIDTRAATTNNTGLLLCLDNASTGAWAFFKGSTKVIAATVNLSLNTWQYVAVTRVAGKITLYLNGTNVGSATDSQSFTDTVCRIGSTVDNIAWSGYIDDLRVSKGVGRYPYNFTPPTAEFPNIGGTVTLTADPYYDYTTLLLPGNGTNGAQNNTFLDSSTNNFTITRNGNTTQGTFSPFSQTGWGNYFDGTSGQYLNTVANTAFNFGTGDFTVEAWVYPTGTLSVPMPIIEIRTTGGATGFAFLRTASAQTLNVYTNSAFVGASTISLVLNSWNHVALTRSGNTWSYWINGTSAGSFTNSSTQSDGGTTGPKIGGSTSAGEVWIGYISNARITKGGALYTSNFTPSTTPLTTTVSAGTVSLLTCQSNRFLDSSSNAFAITINGSPSVQAFSPFNPTASWSAATYGGSGYFDGSGDYLSAASNAAFALPGAFTFECWFYPRSFDQTASWGDTIFTTTTSGGIVIARPTTGTGNSWGVGNVGVAWIILSTTLPTNNAWNHIVVVRDGSNNISLFLNGTRLGTTTSSASFAQAAVTIGSDNNAADSFIDGYLSGVRLVKGTAVYDPTASTITVPTAPLTAITNTSLLLNYTNAGIYDATSKNDLETVGNAQISTAQSKFGGSSMLFDGVGDWLIMPTGPNLVLGTGDFTIECWLRPGSQVGSNNSFVGSNASGGPILNLIGSGTSTSIAFNAYGSANIFNISYTFTQNTWVHVAVARYGTSLRLFINGIQTGSTVTDSTNFSGFLRTVGMADNGNQIYVGYIQDLRITKGIARYTSNFTPPSTAFLTL